jgi:hypothetical protein
MIFIHSIEIKSIILKKRNICTNVVKTPFFYKKSNNKNQCPNQVALDSFLLIFLFLKENFKKNIHVQ